MNLIDPLTAEIGKRGEIVIARQPFRLKASNLTCRCRLPGDRMTTDNPAHRGIARQTLGIVYIFVSGEATEHGLTQETDQNVARVLTATTLRQHCTGERGQAERIVQFMIGEQPSIRRDA